MAWAVSLASMVSIRAPVLRPGRLSVSKALAISLMFQSAPRSCDRGDVVGLLFAAHVCGFNPRPGLATGATSTAKSSANSRPVSIRAPVLRPGRHFTHHEEEIYSEVSIRAPVLRPGRLANGVFVAGLDAPVSIRAPVLRPGRRQGRPDLGGIVMFQSAPRSCDRGDARAQ